MMHFNRFFNYNILLKFVIVIIFLKAIHGKTNKVIIIIIIIIICFCRSLPSMSTKHDRHLHPFRETSLFS